MEIEARNTGYTKFESKIMQKLLRYPLVAVTIHWTFQSLFYMDPTERRFKLMLDVVPTVTGGVLLSRWLPWKFAWVAAFLVAHTINFLFNGQLWGALKFYGFVNNTYEAFENYTQSMAERIKAESSIGYAAVYGSRTRSEWKSSSDLDLRLVRRPGWRNGLRACVFVLIERARALFLGFPLDIYVLDDFDSLARLRPDELPMVLLTRRNK